MKLLWLGSSNDLAEVRDPSRQAPAIAAAALSRELGSDVEPVTRPIWPSPRLPSLVQKWMEEQDPDLVYMKSRPYAFCYESVPLRAERLLGPAGKPISRLGFRLADTPRIAHTPVLRAFRRLALATAGGSTFYTPQQVLAVLEACVRIVVRSEKATLVVRGPVGNSDFYHSKDARRRGEEKRRWADRALARFCAELHVPYISAERPRYETLDLDYLGDRVHIGERGVGFEAREAAEALTGAWRDDRQGVPSE